MIEFSSLLGILKKKTLECACCLREYRYQIIGMVQPCLGQMCLTYNDPFNNLLMTYNLFLLGTEITLY
jgi:hypothetical protein